MKNPYPKEIRKTAITYLQYSMEATRAMTKESLDVSYVLTPEQRAARLKLKEPDDHTVDLYQGKKKVCSFSVSQNLSPEIIRATASQYKNWTKPEKKEIERL